MPEKPATAPAVDKAAAAAATAATAAAAAAAAPLGDSGRTGKRSKEPKQKKRKATVAATSPMTGVVAGEASKFAESLAPEQPPRRLSRHGSQTAAE